MRKTVQKRGLRRFLWMLPLAGGIAAGAISALISFNTEKGLEAGNRAETSVEVMRKNDSLQTCGKPAMTRTNTLATLPRQPHD